MKQKELNERFKKFADKVAMSEFEELLYKEMSESFRAKLRELPPPPDGYYYFPELSCYEIKDGNCVVTMNITLKKRD